MDTCQPRRKELHGDGYVCCDHYMGRTHAMSHRYMEEGVLSSLDEFCWKQKVLFIHLAARLIAFPCLIIVCARQNNG